MFILDFMLQEMGKKLSILHTSIGLNIKYMVKKNNRFIPFLKVRAFSAMICKMTASHNIMITCDIYIWGRSYR